MSKKDYISSASKKIYNYNEKKSVEDELDSHISEKIAYWTEIGYDDETAEQKALESMGDAELICDELGELHNDSYSPTLDIVYISIWAVVLSGIYFLLNKFIFGDAGAISLDISAIFVGIAFALGHVSIATKRGKWQSLLLSLIATGGTGLYLYKILEELNYRFNGDIRVFFQFVIHSTIHSGSNYAPKSALNLAFSIIMSLISLGIIIAVVNQIKAQANVNTLFDNKAKRIVTKLTRYFSTLSLAVVIVFGVKYFADVNTLYNEYVSAQNLALEIADECATKKDIDKFIKDNNLSFETSKDSKGKTTNYYYKSNYTTIDISFENDEDSNDIPTPTSDEMKAIVEAYNDTVNQYLNRPIIKEAVSIINKQSSITKTKTVYTIRVNADTSEFKDNHRSLSLKKLMLSDEDEERLRKFIPFNNNEMNYQRDFYTTIRPGSLCIQKRNRVGQDKYSFEYLVKYTDTFYTESREFLSSMPSENEFYEKRNSIVDTIKSNPNMSYSQIAKATNTKLEKPSFSADELITELGFEYAKKERKNIIRSSYDSLVVFKINDEWSFNVIGHPAEYIQFYHYDKMGGLPFEMQPISDRSAQSTSMLFDFGKTSIRGYYFDRYGKCYTSPDRVPCYKSDGTRLDYITITEYTGDTSIGNIKTNYYSDSKSIYYEVDKCYIDENGYVIYAPSSIEQHDDGYYYTPSNKKYVLAKSASWDENGNLIEMDTKTATFLEKYMD